MNLIREDYLKLIRPYYDVDLIKVITGVRRSGKSVLMDTIKDEIIANGVKGSHIISINLEDLDYSFITDIKLSYMETSNSSLYIASSRALLYFLILLVATSSFIFEVIKLA